MNGTLEQFEIAARDLEKLIGETSGNPSTITSLWVERAQAALNRADALIQQPNVPVEQFRFCGEVKHYRQALLALKAALEESQRVLASRNSNLRGEHTRLRRVQNWAEAVEALT